MTTDNLGPLIFFMVGLLVLCMATYWFFLLRYKLAHFNSLKSKVVGHSSRKFAKIDRLTLNHIYSVKIEYIHPSTKETKHYIEPLSTFWKRFKINQELVLFIDPKDDKATPVINSFLSKYLGIIVCGFIGLVLFLSPVAYWLGWKNIFSP